MCFGNCKILAREGQETTKRFISICYKDMSRKGDQDIGKELEILRNQFPLLSKKLHIIREVFTSRLDRIL